MSSTPNSSIVKKTKALFETDSEITNKIPKEERKKEAYIPMNEKSLIYPTNQ